MAVTRPRPYHVDGSFIYVIIDDISPRCQPNTVPPGSGRIYLRAVCVCSIVSRVLKLCYYAEPLKKWLIVGVFVRFATMFVSSRGVRNAVGFGRYVPLRGLQDEPPGRVVYIKFRPVHKSVPIGRWLNKCNIRNERYDRYVFVTART